MTNKTNKGLWLALIWTGAGTAAWGQPAPQMKILYTFTKRAEGVDPNNSVTVGSGGVLYGTTPAGGKYNSGVLYSLTPPVSPGGPWTEAVLANFEGNGATRENPDGPLVVATNGVIYGSTMGDYGNFGNGYFNGSVYSLRPPAAPGDPWHRTAICSFSPQDGPLAIAMGHSGILYGVTAEGGTTTSGVVFSCAPPASPGDGWSETVLYDVPSGGSTNFGANLVLGPGGVIYSTSSSTLSNGGSAFSLTPPATPGDTWGPATLFDFPTTADGTNPDGLVRGSGGVLYGTTSLGGSSTVCAGIQPGCGVVFALAPPTSPDGAWTETVLHSFNDTPDGAYPNPLTIGAGGVLYGSTYSGGTFGYGTLFSLTPPTSPDGSWTYALLYSFTGGSDGGNPNGLTPGPDGLLYGTTSGVVGNPDFGTVFAFLP